MHAPPDGQEKAPGCVGRAAGGKTHLGVSAVDDGATEGMFPARVKCARLVTGGDGVTGGPSVIRGWRWPWWLGRRWLRDFRRAAP